MPPILPRLSAAVALLMLATAAIAADRDSKPSHDAKPSREAQQSCAVVGDSIAVGAGQYMRACRVNAKIGISSGAVIDRVDPSADVNVVSAGSNDPDNPKLRANLERIRSRTKRAIWILPIETRARAAVQAVAAAHGDPVVSFAPAGDHVHPRSEVALARSIAVVIGVRS
jgi:uncharacterized protein with von Willebrand factor type A (vWA) domain